MVCQKLEVSRCCTLYYTGPSIKEGPLPAAFYFALSGKQSLTLQPINQPVCALAGERIRCFSMTLPGHDEGRDPNEALASWTEGENPFEAFFDSVIEALDYLYSKNLVTPGKCASTGLSRGAFIATHLAARDERFSHILGYAPLTKLRNYDLEAIASKIVKRPLRFYIGNHDTRVGTDHCCHFIQTLANASFEQGIRSSPVELIMGPSIGHKGHGTAEHIFNHGATWIKEQFA